MFNESEVHVNVVLVSMICHLLIFTCDFSSFSLQNVAHSGKLLTEGLQQLSDVLQKLKSFIDSPQQAKHSKLIKEVNSYTSPEQSQLLHNLSSAGGYIQLFIHLSKCVPVSVSPTHFNILFSFNRSSLVSCVYSIGPVHLVRRFSLSYQGFTVR